MISPTNGESEARTLVRQYVALRNYAKRSGDVAPMLALASPKCQSCKGNAALVTDVFKAGGSFIGEYEERVVGMEGDEGTIYVVTRDGNWSKVPSPGAKPEVFQSATLTADYLVQREGAKWLVREIRAYAE